MVRLIPRKTKVKFEFFRGVTGLDIILGAIFLAIAIVLFTANFDYHIWIGFAWVIVAVSLFFKFADDVRFYTTMVYLLKFMVQKKKFTNDSEGKKGDINTILPYNGVIQDRYIDFGIYYGMVLEVQPMFFTLLTENFQDNVIDSFANALRRLNNDQTCSIVKIRKPMVLDNYIYNENKKYDTLYDMQYDGQITEAEIDARAPIFEERVSFFEYINRQQKIYKDYFYIVVYDRDRELLENTVSGMMTALATSLNPISSKILNGKDLYVFLKANLGKEFDQRDLDVIPFNKYKEWIKPAKIKFNIAKFFVDKDCYRVYNLIDYPLQVGNAWAASFFLLDRTKVVMKFNPMPRMDSEKQIDKAIMEMESKLGKAGRSSTQIDYQTHLDTLRQLLVSLKNNNEQLFNVNTYITSEESAKKDVRAMLKQQGFRYSEMFSRQIDGFISSNISRLDSMKSTKRGMPTTTLAASFPFISNSLQDENGMYLGDNEYPVFVDFFKRDRERVNSNMMII